MPLPHEWTEEEKRLDVCLDTIDGLREKARAWKMVATTLAMKVAREDVKRRDHRWWLRWAGHTAPDDGQ